MTPISLSATQKLAGLFSTNGALSQALAAITGTNRLATPQVVLTAASQELADMSLETGYPRVCVYSTGWKNTLAEKFRTFSGTVAVSADIWVSGELVDSTGQLVHHYAEAVASILQSNIGDWGDGFYFDGRYEMQIQGPKAGGFGFVQLAKLGFLLNVSQS